MKADLFWMVNDKLFRAFDKSADLVVQVARLTDDFGQIVYDQPVLFYKVPEPQVGRTIHKFCGRSGQRSVRRSPTSNVRNEQKGDHRSLGKNGSGKETYFSLSGWIDLEALAKEAGDKGFRLIAKKAAAALN
jgi:hypothetical protein